MIFRRISCFLLAVAVLEVLSVSAYPHYKRTGSQPVLVGEPALIDPKGVYIRVTRLSDGSFMAGYAAVEGDLHILRTAKSTNNGTSWTHLGEVYRKEQRDGDIDNASPVQLPNGRVLYAYRNHDRVNYTETYYRITISYSDDSGVTFKYLSEVDQRARDGVNGLWEPFLRIAHDGSLQCYYSAENEADDQDSLMRTSVDGGLTWGAPVTVSGAGVTSRDGMVGVAPIDDDGNLIAVFENTEDSPEFNVRAVTSNDDGKTWNTDRRVLYQPSRANKSAGAPQIYNAGSTLVMSFMTNEDHGEGKGYDGGDMKIIISIDGAKNWGPSFVTGPSPAHWPGLFDVSKTRLMALYSQTGKGAISQLFDLI